MSGKRLALEIHTAHSAAALRHAAGTRVSLAGTLKMLEVPFLFTVTAEDVRS